MNNTEIAKKINKSRQLLEAALKGDRNFSYQTAKEAVSVIGGTVETWMDPENVEERRQLVSALKGKASDSVVPVKEDRSPGWWERANL